MIKPNLHRLRIGIIALIPSFAAPYCAFAQQEPAPVSILQIEDPVPENAVRLAERSLTGNDVTGACAYYELLLQAEAEAGKAGANALKIVHRASHSRTQRCDELQVAFYKVPDVLKAEQSFCWSDSRPLAWDDFRGPERTAAGPSAVAETSCGIAIETNLARPGDRVKVYVYNTFSKQESWVKPAAKRADVLEHEQGHWNICELYTRRMQAQFDRANITGDELSSKVSAIYESVTRDYIARQQRYEEETAHGTIGSAQHQWTTKINDELAAGMTSKL